MQSQAVAPRRRRTSLFVFFMNYTYPSFRGGGRERGTSERGVWQPETADRTDTMRLRIVR